MKWQDILTYIVMPILTVLIIPGVVYVFNHVFNKLSDHDTRIVKVETVTQGIAADVKAGRQETKLLARETKTQTRMLDRLLGKMGMGMDDLDRQEQGGEEEEVG